MADGDLQDDVRELRKQVEALREALATVAEPYREISGYMEQLQTIAERRGVPFEWANLMDALQSERDQNITIDTAQIWFQTRKRQYVIIAADVVESKLRLAEKMGAHQVVDARRDPVKQIMDITGNRGADVVIDLVGNDLFLANGMKMLHKGGTLIIVGYGGTLSVKAIDVIFSEFSVLGSLVGNWDELRELMELTRQGKIRVITQKGKLDEVNDILDQLKKGTLEGRGVVIP